jgi:homocitrate synthase NifV
MMDKPYFIDTTLRDGEQAPGVVFSLADKIQIAALLDRIGVQEVELGTPAMGVTEVKDMQTLTRMGFSFKTLAWCRATMDDLRKATQSGTRGVHLSFPVSPLLMKAMGKTETWVFDQLKTLVEAALSSFEYVTVGAQDASRAEPKLLADFVCAASLYGASRVRLADTVGLLNPFSTVEMITVARRLEATIPLEFHGHNDLGMATANTLSAFSAGATSFSTTINGLGERAGNASMDEVALALELSLNQPCGLDSTLFPSISQLVATASNRSIPVDKPIVGKLVLSHESGIHTNCLIKNRSTYQLIPADKLGIKERDFVLGKHSGTSSIRHYVEQAGLPLTELHCHELTQRVRKLAEIEKQAVSGETLMTLYSQLLTETPHHEPNYSRS